MSTELSRIADKARNEPKLRFTALAHLLTPEFLTETWGLMNRRGASGIDGETTKEFEQDLEERCRDIVARLKANRYQAPPVRRVEIPKGGGKTRPLGIPTVEDRLVQRAVARILEAIYEADFRECSYGFRPGRSPHQALRDLRRQFIAGKAGYVFETDIRGYFNHINHDWLRKMLAQRVGDPVILHLIGKWLGAGVMSNGVVTRTEEGTPQGGPISPLLANVYLHYVLDLWFERRFRGTCRGEAYLTRFADDFVVGFQHEQDAQRFAGEIVERMRKFGLELAAEKTRLLAFGRFAREREAHAGRKPGTFDFLGFTHVCGTGAHGQYVVVRIPCVKSCRKFLDRVHAWLKAHQHWRRRDQQAQLARMLSGFYQYFGLNHCYPKLSWIRSEVEKQWARSLRRRSQRHRLFWTYLMSRAWFELPKPRLVHATV
jgi:group II intron reverse transcriptase/maturase